MRCVVTGNGPDGRSKVVSVVEFDSSAALWRSPVPTVTPPDDTEPMDLDVGPGGLRYLAASFTPGTSYDMHWTATIDVDTVLRGSVDLVLDEETVRLEVGDCAVVAGVRHGWRAGPDGTLMTVLVLGAAPPR
jgi:quercetin dioxygenase-like cupin family protein